jgi:hypothetical protein
LGDGSWWRGSRPCQPSGKGKGLLASRSCLPNFTTGSATPQAHSTLPTLLQPAGGPGASEEPASGGAGGALDVPGRGLVRNTPVIRSNSSGLISPRASRSRKRASSCSAVSRCCPGPARQRFTHRMAPAPRRIIPARAAADQINSGETAGLGFAWPHGCHQATIGCTRVLSAHHRGCPVRALYYSAPLQGEEKKLGAAAGSRWRCSPQRAHNGPPCQRSPALPPKLPGCPRESAF